MVSDDEILAVFHDEVGEQLETLASMLDASPSEWDVRVAFRVCHNMKGSARMVGAKSVARLTHILEELFSSLRAGQPLDDHIVELARKGAQLLEGQFTDSDDSGEEAIDGYEADVAAAIDRPAEEPHTEAESPDEAEPQAPNPPPADQLDTDPVDELDDSDGADHFSGPDDTTVESPQQSSAGADSAVATGETVRVSTQRLDRLMGLATELSTSGRTTHRQSKLIRQLLQTVHQLGDEYPWLRKDEQFRSVLDTGRTLRRSVSQSQDRQNKFSRELREIARQLRMVPLQSLSTVFSRVVRQACRVTGKQAEFRLEGGHTELDRGVLDAIRDPVIHLLRNAVAHGIEEPEVRRQRDKPQQGRILLSARSVGTWVELEVSDDGAGLDLEAIRQRVVDRELMSPKQARSADDDQLQQMLFTPGFSATEEVSEISGRGVGLDVVENNLSQLGGKVSVDNRPGRGASFVLHVPLTQLTSKLLHLRLGDHSLLVPMSDVVTTARLANDELRMADGQQVAFVAGEPVPVTSLETVIDVSSPGQDIRPAVLLATENRRRLFLVDQVIGEESILIQSLHWNLRDLEPYAGCAVLADGDVALVLDVQVLLGELSGTVDSDWIRGVRDQARQRRILVVDDSVTSRTLIENILSSAGYDVTVAVDGIQAIDQTRQQRFDLVITDVEMPRLDGFGLVKKLRSQETTGDLPIIMVTSLGQQKQKQKAARLGADEYVVKGAFDQDQLLGAVSRLL